MFIEKKLFHLPFSKKRDFNIIYEDINDLKNGIIELCELLKKDLFIIQLFSQDTLCVLLKKQTKFIVSHRNFLFHVVDNLSVLEQISFEGVRFLNIYSVSNEYSKYRIDKMIKCSSFNLELENYLEYTEISICFDEYNDFIISKLPIK